MPSPEGAGGTALEGLQKRLLRYKQDIAAEERPEVPQAIHWLIEHRRDGGFWSEEDDEGTTALCALALSCWASRPGGRQASVAASQLHLDRTADWLEARAARGLSTPWYRAVSLRALCALGRGRGPAASDLAQELSGHAAGDAQAWSRRGHHAAQISMALAARGADGESLEPWYSTILRGLESANDVYVEGQMVEALVDGHVSPALFPASIERLSAYLRRNELSKASFVEYVPALLALSSIRSTSEEIEGLVREKTTELLKKWDETGWYRDPEYVAWALLVLHESTVLTHVSVDLPTFDSAFDQARRTLASEQLRTRRTVARWSFLFGADVAALALLGVIDPKSFIVTAVVAGLLLTALPVLGKLLWDDLRR